MDQPRDVIAFYLEVFTQVGRPWIPGREKYALDQARLANFPTNGVFASP
jgi:hypothetical protein